MKRAAGDDASCHICLELEDQFPEGLVDVGLAVDPLDGDHPLAGRTVAGYLYDVPDPAGMLLVAHDLY